MDSPQKPKRVLRQVANWKNLYFYQKADTLYQMTFVFCDRFLPKYGDRTVDQMIQAARSGKQNIVEGSEDGMTSTEMELKLLNVARSSIGELKEDYQDYIKAHHITQWTKEHPRFQSMQDFTKQHNRLDEYEPYFLKWSEEEMTNIGLTLCFQVDAMMNSYLVTLENRFVEEGGIKERMYSARTGYRQEQDKKFQDIQNENAQLKKENAELKAQLEQAKADYADLHQRALTAYNQLKEELKKYKG